MVKLHEGMTTAAGQLVHGRTSHHFKWLATKKWASARTDDKSFGSRTRVVKGIAGDQGQQLTRGGLQNPRLVGTDNLGEHDTVVRTVFQKQ
jgi:hypothetical protein